MLVAPRGLNHPRAWVSRGRACTLTGTAGLCQPVQLRGLPLPLCACLLLALPTSFSRFQAVNWISREMCPYTLLHPDISSPASLYIIACGLFLFCVLHTELTQLLSVIPGGARCWRWVVDGAGDQSIMWLWGHGWRQPVGLGWPICWAGADSTAQRPQPPPTPPHLGPGHLPASLPVPCPCTEPLQRAGEGGQPRVSGARWHG